MGKPYKYHMSLVETPDPAQQRREIQSMPLENGSPFPSTVTYEDIDAAFKEWAETKIDLSFEGKRVPTMTLLSGQRFSEYAQSWQYTDENRNLLMNFKAVTRDNNPKKGSIHGNYFNIPGDRYYPMFRRYTQEENGRLAVDVYETRQPVSVDLDYSLSIVTNKYELVNEFNMAVNDRFKAIQDYICPNGHYMPMKVTGISDTSEYNLDDRKFFSQTVSILIMAYLVREQDFRVTHYPGRSIYVMDGDSVRSKPSASVEDGGLAPGDEGSPYYYRQASVEAEFPAWRDTVKFTMDKTIVVQRYDYSNMRSFKLYLNDNRVFHKEEITINEGDRVRIKAYPVDFSKPSSLTLAGYYPGEVYDSRLDNPESELDATQSADEVKVEY